MNTDNFVVYINTEEIYVDIPKDVETRFDSYKDHYRKGKEKSNLINEP